MAKVESTILEAGSIAKQADGRRAGPPEKEPELSGERRKTRGPWPKGVSFSGKVEFKVATEADAAFVGAHLREADKAEILALGEDPAQAVERSRRASDKAWAGLIGGELSMVFGCAQSLLAESGEVWALGTDNCTRHPREMLLFGRIVLREILKDFPVLENYCDARYEKALRWLKRIGFRVSAPVPYGKDGALFCKITARQGV